MRTPDQYIIDLLFEFDCVTIPGFGGFIMHSRSARLDEARHRIFPPTRVPSFNSLLNHDDGLLISRVSTGNGLSYKEASNNVADFVNELRRRIASGETVELEGIGSFRQGIEDEIMFYPHQVANFLPTAFGMEAQGLFSVNRQAEFSRKDSKPADRSAKQIRHRNPKPVRWTLAVSLPIVALLLYGIIFPASIQTIYMNYSGIVVDFFTSKEFVTTPEFKLTETTVTMPAPVEIKEEEENKILPETITSHEIKADPAPVNPSEVAPKFYIIGGCFEKEENADKFLAWLLKKGYEAEKAGVTKKGHTRISYKSFTEKDPALSFLLKIKDTENPGAWLLKY